MKQMLNSLSACYTSAEPTLQAKSEAQAVEVTIPSKCKDPKQISILLRSPKLLFELRVPQKRMTEIQKVTIYGIEPASPLNIHVRTVCQGQPDFSTGTFQSTTIDHNYSSE